MVPGVAACLCRIKMMILFYWVCLVAFPSTHIPTSHAYPSGAGQCLVGEASVGSPHIPDTQGDDGTLAGISIALFVDGSIVSDPSVPFALTPGSDHTLAVQSTDSGTFRGFLIAVSPASTSTTIDLSSAWTPDLATGQIANACSSPIAGITHFDNSDKSSASGVLRVNEEVELLLDVTVVIQNSNGISSYGWNQYKASTAGAATGSPTILATTTAPNASPGPSSGPPNTSPVAAPSPTASSPSAASPSSSPVSMSSPTITPEATPEPTSGASGGGGGESKPTMAPTKAKSAAVASQSRVSFVFAVVTTITMATWLS